MGNWEEMDKYVMCLDGGSDTQVTITSLNTSGSGNGASDGAFFRAVLCVWRSAVLPPPDRYHIQTVVLLCITKFCEWSYISYLEIHFWCAIFLQTCLIFNFSILAVGCRGHQK